MAPNKRRVTKSVILGSNFKTKPCELKCRSQDISDKNEEYCQKESENEAVKGSPAVSKNTNGESHVTSELTETTEEISSISQSSHECKCSKTYRTYKSQLQPITKYFRTSGSKKKPINNESSEQKETPTLHDSSQDSSQCSNGVFQVSTKFRIDIFETPKDYFLLTDYSESPLEKSENSERFRENVSLIVRKRSNEECSKLRSSKKPKADDKGNVIKKTQWSSHLSTLSFEFSDDEEKQKESLTNGNKKSPTMYLCKHCDYSEVTIAHLRSHYDNDHPYVRYETTYIQDLCDQSATFRCLECPVEFLSVPDLQRHYTKNHPDRPDFQNTSSQLHLVYKCFGCSYITEELGDLKTHYRETHPTYQVDNALKYCRYSLSSSHSYHDDDMKSQFSDSEVLSLEKRRKTEIHSSMPDCPTSSIHPGNDCRKSPEQSACVTSDSTLQFPANQSSESVTCENISHFPEETKKGEVTLSLNPQNTPEASKLHAELKTTSEAVKPAGDVSEVEKSPAIMSVAEHHNAKHFAQHSSIESKVMLYNSIPKEKLQSKPETPVTTPDSERRKQVCGNGDDWPEIDKASDASVTELNPYSHPENLFYCHICNYGGRSPVAVIIHQAHSHPKRIASLERVNNHTALIREEMKKSTLEVNNASFSCNLPLPILLKNEKQVFFCHLCNYRQKTLRQVLRHCLLKHCGVAVSAEEVERYTSMVLQQRSKPLESITGQEDNQSHGKEEVPRTKTDLGKDTAAATKQQRVQEQHPDQKMTCKDVNTQLHAAPKSASPKTRKSKEVSLTFHAYQVPLEFDTSPGSLAACVCVSPEHLKCSCCAATFPTQDCPDIHCVHKYKGDTMKKDAIHTCAHFYICPHCPYVNIKHQGVLSHCQRKHPVLSPGADRFSIDQIYSNNCEESMENKGHLRERGYICKTCSQICATLEKLNRHIDEAHISTEASSELKQPQTAQLSNVNGNNRENLSNPLKSGPKVSLSNDVNKYLASALKSQECFYTCALCPKFYSSRKHLGEHYVEKHGKEAFSKYCTDTSQILDKGVSKINSSPQSKPDSVSSKQVASETCDSSLMSAEKKLVFKCPKCPFVHASHSSILAHCCTRHPRLLSRGCKFQTDVINAADVIKCQSLGVSSRIRGYACGQCPQVHNSLKTLRIHCDLEHNHATPPASEHPEGSDYQTKSSQGFAPEALSSPSANDSEMSPGQSLPKTEPEQQKHLKCKVCPNVTFDSAEQLIFHYSTLHFSDRMLDFIVLSRASGKSSGLYRCSLCRKQVLGIQKMHHHLDHHRRGRIEPAVESADMIVSAVDPPLIKPATQVQNHLPVFETMEDQAQWNVTPGETFTALPSPPSSLIKPTDPQEPALEPEKDGLTGKYYVIIGPVETDSQAEDNVNEDCPVSREEESNASALNGKAAVNEEPLCSEPPDVQQELNQISLKAQGQPVFEANWEEATLPDISMLRCELCNFNTQHLPNMQQHYQQWHGNKMLKCQDCSFATVLRKTLNIHIETGHSACLSKPNHVKDFHCPFCLFLSKNKNTMIDHIISHREEPVVPGEVSPPKLSCDLLGTFTSGAAKNLRLRVMEHEDVQPYRCRLCYFDCTQLKDLEAHLTDKHHVIRNHELVSQLVLQQEASVSRVSEEPRTDTQDHSSENLDITTHDREAKSQGEDGIREDVPQIHNLNGKNEKEEFHSKSSVLDLQKEHGRGHRIENTREGKAEVVKEAQVNELCMRKQRVLQKSDGNLPLRIKGRHRSVSEPREPKSTTEASDYKTRLRAKATLPSERTGKVTLRDKNQCIDGKKKRFYTGKLDCGQSE